MQTTMYLKHIRCGDLESFIRILNDNGYTVTCKRNGTVSTRVDISKNENIVKDTTITIRID